MSINRRDLQEAIKCPEWQKLRESLKGRPTVIKLEVCREYLQPTTWNSNSNFRVNKTCCPMYNRQLQVLNYVTSLSRGGLIDPVPRAWQWPEHIDRWLAGRRYVIRGEG